MSKDKVSTTQKNNRIRALDIIRGYFLVVILINHIELYPSFFDFFTGRGRLFVSAAEGFFFMSGLLVGMVYKRRLQYGMKFIFKKMWRRAFILYIGSVFLTLLFTFLAIKLRQTDIKQGLATNFTWSHLVGDTLLLKYNFGWSDFLDRFAIMMFMAPFAFYLLSKGRWIWVAIISFALWAAPGNENPLDTLNWQIIFIMGMLAGFYWQELGGWFKSLKPKTQKRFKLSIAWFSGITFAFSYFTVFGLSKLNQRLLGQPDTMSNGLKSLTNHLNSINYELWLYAQKWTLGPLRILLFITWFIVLFLLIQRYEKSITRYTKGFFELLGRNSLFVYIDHAFIVFVFKFFIPSNTNIWQNFLITGAALILLVTTTYFYVNTISNKNRAQRLAATTNR